VNRKGGKGKNKRPSRVLEKKIPKGKYRTHIPGEKKRNWPEKREKEKLSQQQQKKRKDI